MSTEQGFLQGYSGQNSKSPLFFRGGGGCTRLLKEACKYQNTGTSLSGRIDFIRAASCKTCFIVYSAFVIYFYMQSLKARATSCTEPDWFQACLFTQYILKDTFLLEWSSYYLSSEQLTPLWDHKAGFHCATNVLVKVLA